MHSTNSTALPQKRAKKVKTKSEFFCPYCKKEFQSETPLIKHMCAKKDRELEKDEKHIRMAYQVYAQFYRLNQKQEKSWGDFRDSRYYNDFVKVGRYIIDTNPINVGLFIDFLVKSGRPVLDWTKQSMYELYIRETIKKETPCAAVERNILLMQQWATTTGNDWSDFFRMIAPAQATMWIKSGRISPWVLYICESAEELMVRMSPEQIGMIQSNLDPDFWNLKMDKYPDDVKFLRETFKEAGL